MKSQMEKGNINKILEDHAKSDTDSKNRKKIEALVADVEQLESLPPERKKKKKRRVAPIGTTRGIETMFRNSYRAQLSLISLAATKANIMISVNGFILSILMVSGSYFITSEPRLMLPSSVFIVTCLASIIFAVLAARPKVDNAQRTLDDLRNDNLNVLAFEQFSQLPEDDYVTGQLELMQDNERIYKSMIKHIYLLGKGLDKKFRLLRLSYTLFWGGMVASVALLLFVSVSPNISLLDRGDVVGATSSVMPDAYCSLENSQPEQAIMPSNAGDRQNTVSQQKEIHTNPASEFGAWISAPPRPVDDFPLEVSYIYL